MAEQTEHGLEQEPTLAEIAFRQGQPEDWERVEHNYEVANRVCGVLGLARHTDEIREVSITESDRQTGLFNEYKRGLRKKEEYEALEKRMGGVAMSLVDALVPADDPRDRNGLVKSVLEALKPIDERLVRAEWDGLIGR